MNNAQPGAYEVQVQAAQRDGKPVAALVGGAVLPESSEYRISGTNTTLLDALARVTGGRMNPLPNAVFDATHSHGGVGYIVVPWLLWFALILVPVEIAIRRCILGELLKGRIAQRLWRK